MTNTESGGDGGEIIPQNRHRKEGRFFMNSAIIERKAVLPILAEDFIKQLDSECYKSARGGGCILVGDPTQEMEYQPVSEFERRESPIFIDAWPIEPPTNSRRYYLARLTVSVFLKPGDVLHFVGRKPYVLDRGTDPTDPIHLTEPAIVFEILPLSNEIQITGKYSDIVVNGKPMMADFFNWLWGQLVPKPPAQQEKFSTGAAPQINIDDLDISDREKEGIIIRQMTAAGYEDKYIAGEIRKQIGHTTRDAVKQKRLRMGLKKRKGNNSVP